MSKIQLTESELKQIVESAAKEIVKEKLNEWNSYKVDFKNLGEPKNKPRVGAGGNYWSNKKTKDLLANGTYGANRVVDMSSFVYDMEDLGYTKEQIQQGIKNGSIQLRDKQGNQFNTRRQNRKVARLMTNAGGILGTGPESTESADTRHHLVRNPEETPAPLPTSTGTEIQTKTIYFKSPEVGQIQQLLNDKYTAGLKVDNTCGPLTVKAILNALQHPNPEVDRMRERTKTDMEQSQVSTGAQQTVKSALDNAASKVEPQKDMMTGKGNATTVNQGPKPMASDFKTNKMQEVGRQMSSIFSDKNMSPAQKKNSLNAAYNNAIKQGGLTDDQIKQLKMYRDKYISGLNA